MDTEHSLCRSLAERRKLFSFVRIIVFVYPRILESFIPNLHFPCLGNLYKILVPLHQQSFSLTSIPINSISYLLQSLDKGFFLCIFLYASSRNTDINNLSYWSQFLHTKSFLPASILGETILTLQLFNFHL